MSATGWKHLPDQYPSDVEAVYTKGGMIWCTKWGPKRSCINWPNRNRHVQTSLCLYFSAEHETALSSATFNRKRRLFGCFCIYLITHQVTASSSLTDQFWTPRVSSLFVFLTHAIVLRLSNRIWTAIQRVHRQRLYDECSQWSHSDIRWKASKPTAWEVLIIYI